MIARTLRYRVFRAQHGTRKPLTHEASTLEGARAVARRALMEAAEIQEIEVLPLGCEAVARIGTVTVLGHVHWHRERRRA